MTRIAHLSDMHLNGSAERHGRFARALGQAAASGATHLLLTGDLTATGRPVEFSELAFALRGWPARAVTAVPGNHDGGPEAWCCALGGPLRVLRATSAFGAVTDLGDAVVVPVNTQLPKPPPLFTGRGHVNLDQLVRIDRVARDAAGRCVVVAAHHGPQEDPLHLFMGMVNPSDVEMVLERNGQISWCCGHDHRVFDRCRVFAAGSVATHDDPLRVYDVAGIVSGADVPEHADGQLPVGTTMIENVILADGIHMRQSGVYRGRLLIHAPHFIAGDDTVREKLGEEGFSEVVFFDKANLPPDWPADQREDPSSTLQWTAYVQGRFTMTDRVIPISELGTKVTLLGMWINMPDAAAQPEQRPPVPEPTPPPKPDPVLTPSVVTVPSEPTKQASLGGKLAASAAGVALGFAAVQMIRRKGAR